MESLSLSWNLSEDQEQPVLECLTQTDWKELCAHASRLNHNQPCIALDKINAGLNHVVRLLYFENSRTYWVVRIPFVKDKAAGYSTLQAEVDTMYFLYEKKTIRVPRIFDYETTANNPVRVPFILMELLPGNVAMDAWGGWKARHGIIPPSYRSGFYQAVAKAQVELVALRFSKIGIVTRDLNGNYDIGPLPQIGGPFTTARSFFIAWAEHAKFPAKSVELLSKMASTQTDSIVQEISESIDEFPSRLATMVASEQIPLDTGPFPICHADLMHSNIVIDDQHNMLGIIDWEGACTLPWELVEYPLFLSTTPRVFNMPDRYDGMGEPIDTETKQCWQDRKSYLGFVELSERTDHRLSENLADTKRQDLACVIRLFSQGKLGFYNRVLDQYSQQ